MSVLKDGALLLLCLLSMIPTLALIYSVLREKSYYTAALYAVAAIGMTNLCCNLLLIFETRNVRVTLLCLWVAMLAFVGKRIIRTREAQRVKPVSLYYVMRAFAVFWVAVFALGFGLVTRTASDFAVFLTNVWLAMTVYFLLLLLLMPLLRRFLRAETCVLLWGMSIALLLRGIAGPGKVLGVFYFPALRWGLYGWAAGCCAVLGWYWLAHVRFVRRVKRRVRIVDSGFVRAAWEQECEENGGIFSAMLWESPDISTPFSMGLREPAVYLPQKNYEPQELRMIFRHELTHLRRNDVGRKIFLAVCNGVGWFCPLTWLATRKAAEDMELSCDEAALSGLTSEERQQYAGLLLATTGTSVGFTTCLSASASALRYRLKRALHPRRMRRGTALCLLALLLCSYAFGSVYPAERRGTLQILLNEPELLQTCFCGGKKPARVVYDTACIGMMLSRMEAEQLIAVPDSSNWGEAFFMCDLENNESVTVYKNCAILYDCEGTAQTAFWLTQPLQFEEARNDA